MEAVPAGTYLLPGGIKSDWYNRAIHCLRHLNDPWFYYRGRPQRSIRRHRNNTIPRSRYIISFIASKPPRVVEPRIDFLPNQLAILAMYSPSWLEVLGNVCDRFNWVANAYCQMTNHYHVLVETVDGLLVWPAVGI